MGRQSSRLYFQGKDHRDIYYNGHYHDAMYLSDNEGNVRLVWEKLKKTLDVKTYFLAYDDELYVAIISRYVEYPNILFYSGNDIYNMDANIIKGVKSERKKIISMFIFKEKLEIVFERSYSIESCSIPVLNGKIDTESPILNELKGYYWYTNTILVGKTCKKYQASLYNSDTGIAMRAGITINNRAISYGEGFEFLSYGVFFVAGKIFVDAFVAKLEITEPIHYLELNNEETELALKEVYIPNNFIQEFKLEALRVYHEKYPTGTLNDWTYSYEIQNDIGYAGSLSVINNTKGFICIRLEAQNGNPLWIRPFAYDGGIYKVVIDFLNFEIISLEKVQDIAIYNTQGFGKNWRVQFTFKRKDGGSSGDYYLSYGRISDLDDNYIPFSEIEGINSINDKDSYYETIIACVAEIGKFLYVGMRGDESDGSGYVKNYYICIDTEANTAKLAEYYIGIKK